MKELIKKIEQWSIERGLDNADPMKQYDKLVEEFGELVKGLNKQDEQMIKDSIGDMFVVITIMTQQIKGDMRLVMDFEHNDELKALGEVSTLRFIGILFGLGEALKNAEANNSLNIAYLLEHTNIHVALANLMYCLDETAKKHGTDLKTCVQLAYDEIKNRNGKIVDGQFVKEEDL